MVVLSVFQGMLERALQPDAHGWIKGWRRCPGRLGAEPDEQTPQACRTGCRGMCPHTVHAAGARSWHCMRSASVLPTRPACRLPRSVPAAVATATTRARARHGHNQPEAACPISVLNLIALSWESWLIRPPDTREIPSSSLGESTPLDLSESFCPLFFFLTAARSAFFSLPAPVPPRSVPPWSPGSFLCAAIQPWCPAPCTDFSLPPSPPVMPCFAPTRTLALP